MTGEHSSADASMEEETKEEMTTSEIEEENVATFTEEGSPRLVIRQMVSLCALNVTAPWCGTPS